MGVAKFRWFKPTLGHVWRVYAGGTRRLAPKSGGSRFFDHKAPEGVKLHTPPLGLFREFARLPWSAKGESRQKALKEFGDNHGDILAAPWEGRVTDAREKWFKHATMDTWCLQIQRMRRAVEMWDQVKNNPEWYKTAANRMILSEELIDSALRDTETPSCATPVLVLKENRIVLCPANLLAFMWLTFARVVAGEIREQPCTAKDLDGNPCPNFVYFEPGVRRYDERATCGDTCRKRKQRPK